MPETIYIGQDINTATPKTIFKPQDFVDLVEEMMGPYARKYLEEELDFQSGNSRSEQEAYDRGYDEGYHDGLEEGYEDGYEHGLAEVVNVDDE